MQWIARGWVLPGVALAGESYWQRALPCQDQQGRRVHRVLRQVDA
ncbi:hypothetical protein XHC_3493 [Xanthomonas hortorum pv. carotae str. M081]|nr:hypothetical protein XHC_3493 [Xanthomonas hortorum pv. carotae str. M081]